MFCKRCGKELRDGSAFCPNCGLAVAEAEVKQTTEKGTAEKRRIKAWPFIAGGGICLLIVLAVLFFAVVMPALRPQMLLTAAAGLMEEGRYEEAILKYEELIDIDPQNADAYLGMAGSYEALGDNSHAKSVLESALKYVKEQDISRIQQRLAEIDKDGQDADDYTAEAQDPSANETPAPVDTPEAGATPAPVALGENVAGRSGEVLSSEELDAVSWFYCLDNISDFNGPGQLSKQEMLYPFEKIYDYYVRWEGDSKVVFDAPDWGGGKQNVILNRDEYCLEFSPEQIEEITAGFFEGELPDAREAWESYSVSCDGSVYKVYANDFDGVGYYYELGGWCSLGDGSFSVRFDYYEVDGDFDYDNIDSYLNAHSFYLTLERSGGIWGFRVLEKSSQPPQGALDYRL